MGQGNRANHRAWRVTFPALYGGISLAILYLSAIVPTGAVGLVALAGVVPAFAIVSGGVRAGLMCYGCAGILGLFFVPNLLSAILYLSLFGLYAVVKHWIERLSRLPLELGLKLVFANLMFALLLYGPWAALFSLPMSLPLWAAFPVGSVLFFLYDYGFSQGIWLYITRIDQPLRRTNRNGT